MNTHLSTLTILMFNLALLGACAENTFQAAKKRTPPPPASAEAAAPEAAAVPPAEEIEYGEASDLQSEVSTMPSLNAEDKGALDQCLVKWNNPPFSAEEIAKPKTFTINEGVNNNGIIFTNSDKTAMPQLYLVNLEINVGNNGILQFFNNQGWYCLNVKAKVINNFIVETATDTQVAIVSKTAQNDKNFTIVKK